MRDRCTAIFDVGKTHSKLSLWSAEGRLLARRARANARIPSGYYSALDTSGIEVWAIRTLIEFASLGRIGKIIPVGHGAAAVLLRNGVLAAPAFDYETPMPAEVRSRYDRERDSFAHTGSPALPDGLNLGAQLHWMEEVQPDLSHKDVMILPWPQYWGWVLSGVAACEVTSLGCHSDLWQPRTGQPSSLAVGRGWADRLAPLRRADEVIGVVRPELVAKTGLSADTQVLCGLHDSNAALLTARGFPEIANRDTTIVSTGTWFVGMRCPRVDSDSDLLDIRLPESRDCLMNVNPYGSPIPSGRFMGGREVEMLTAADHARLDAAADQVRMVDAIHKVVDDAVMVLPTLTPGFGPYPRARHSWQSETTVPNMRRAAIGLYAALVMSESLSLIGAREAIVVEGRFADSDVFVRGLASLLQQTPVYVGPAHDGVPYGALRLVNPSLAPPGQLRRVDPLPVDLAAYAATWRHVATRLEDRA